MIGICAAFVALVIGAVLLANLDSFGGGSPEESSAPSLPPGQVGYDLKGFLYDESFFDEEESTLPIVEVTPGAPEEGTEGYTHVVPEDEPIRVPADPGTKETGSSPKEGREQLKKPLDGDREQLRPTAEAGHDKPEKPLEGGVDKPEKPLEGGVDKPDKPLGN